MLRVAGSSGRRGGDARLAVTLVALGTAAVVLSLEGLQTHGVEGVQLLAVELFAKSRAPVAEPDLHPRLGQFRSAKARTARLVDRAIRQIIGESSVSALTRN